MLDQKLLNELLRPHAIGADERRRLVELWHVRDGVVTGDGDMFRPLDQPWHSLQSKLLRPLDVHLQEVHASYPKVASYGVEWAGRHGDSANVGDNGISVQVAEIRYGDHPLDVRCRHVNRCDICQVVEAAETRQPIESRRMCL